MEEELYILEGKKTPKKRPAIKLTCPVCGKEYLKAKHNYYSDIKRGVKVHYCCRECAQKARENKVQLECSYCGKLFYITPARLKCSQSGHHFCSRECKDAAQKIYTDQSNLEKFKDMLPSHYGSGNKHSENFNYRAYALSIKPHVCERCGYCKSDAALQVHHKDRDRTNNDISNLEVLCANCHAEEHWGN